jgi:hypothetical protein
VSQQRPYYYRYSLRCYGYLLTHYGCSQQEQEQEQEQEPQEQDEMLIKPHPFYKT